MLFCGDIASLLFWLKLLLRDQESIIARLASILLRIAKESTSEEPVPCDRNALYYLSSLHGETGAQLLNRPRSDLSIYSTILCTVYTQVVLSNGTFVDSRIFFKGLF